MLCLIHSFLFPCGSSFLSQPWPPLGFFLPSVCTFVSLPPPPALGCPVSVDPVISPKSLSCSAHIQECALCTFTYKPWPHLSRIFVVLLVGALAAPSQDWPLLPCTFLGLSQPPPVSLGGPLHQPPSPQPEFILGPHPPLPMRAFHHHLTPHPPAVTRV